MQCVITGASSGLGEALARKLAEKYDLLLIGRDELRLKNLQQELQAEALPLDLNDKNNRIRLIAWIHKNSPELVINCAGSGLYGDILEHPTENQMKQFAINSSVPIEISIEAARALYSSQKEGIILNISSIAGYFHFPKLSLYAAAKCALTSFSQSFDFEMKPHGIRILASCPGQIDTDFIYRAGGKKDHPRIGAMTKEYAANRILCQIDKKKPLDIFDIRYRLSLLSLLLPKKLLFKTLAASIDRRYAANAYIGK